MISSLHRAARAFARAHRRRRQLRELLGKDDWILRDVGLTQEEVAHALSRRGPTVGLDNLHRATHYLPAIRAPY